MLSAYDVILASPPCRLGACFSGEALTRLDFLPQDASATASPDARARLLARELDAYWSDPAHRFELSLLPAGTPFQLRVWQALRDIPPGHPTTYGTLARQLGSAPRAVGQACGNNPIPIIIPCHRVVASNGLGGFMHAADGAPLDIKRWLLRHEQCLAAEDATPLWAPAPQMKPGNDFSR